jgi:hypothetical protein
MKKDREGAAFGALPVFFVYRKKKELPIPHRKQLFVTIKNRHTIKFIWHPHTKHYVRHNLVFLTGITIPWPPIFVNEFMQNIQFMGKSCAFYYKISP